MAAKASHKQQHTQTSSGVSNRVGVAAEGGCALGAAVAYYGLRLATFARSVCPAITLCVSVCISLCVCHVDIGTT